MNDLNLDKYLNIVNEAKSDYGLDKHIPLYPMLRVEGDKLYIGVLLTEKEDNVWSIEGKVKPQYWVLIDPVTDKILSWNKTSEKDFVVGDVIPKNINDKQKEISKYTIEKTLQYKEYLINDIKNEQLPLQKKLSNILGNELELDGDLININDYLLSNLEDDIKNKIDDLVNILIQSKYGSLTFYYDKLVKQIVSSYIKDKKIDKTNIKLCIEIMNNYYDGVINIDNFFNI